jgi:hypothetical protein
MPSANKTSLREEPASLKGQIIPRYGGVIIHDCWASYLAYAHCDHGLCGSHLLRELTLVVEANGYRWAANMKRLLLETAKQVVNSAHKCLSQDEYLKLTKRCRVIPIGRGLGVRGRSGARRRFIVRGDSACAMIVRSETSPCCDR